MISVRHEVRIYRPVGEVFAFAGDPANDPHWIGGVLASRRTSPGPLGPGATFAVVSKFLARRSDATTMVEAYEPDRLVRLRSADSPLPYNEARTFEAVGGDTLFTRTMEAEAVGLFGLADGLLADAERRQAEADTHLLKVLLDAHAEGDLDP